MTGVRSGVLGFAVVLLSTGCGVTVDPFTSRSNPNRHGISNQPYYSGVVPMNRAGVRPHEPRFAGTTGISLSSVAAIAGLGLLFLCLAVLVLQREARKIKKDFLEFQAQAIPVPPVKANEVKEERPEVSRRATRRRTRLVVIPSEELHSGGPEARAS